MGNQSPTHLAYRCIMRMGSSPVSPHSTPAKEIFQQPLSLYLVAVQVGADTLVPNVFGSKSERHRRPVTVVW